MSEEEIYMRLGEIRASQERAAVTVPTPENVELPSVGSTGWFWLTCPWCKESDFDEVGLKLHITRGQCDTFEQLSTSVPTTKQANVAISRCANKN